MYISQQLTVGVLAKQIHKNNHDTLYTYCIVSLMPFLNMKGSQNKDIHVNGAL